jgi:hypothetical protein
MRKISNKCGSVKKFMYVLSPMDERIMMSTRSLGGVSIERGASVKMCEVGLTEKADSAHTHTHVIVFPVAYSADIYFALITVFV